MCWLASWLALLSYLIFLSLHLWDCSTPCSLIVAIANPLWFDVWIIKASNISCVLLWVGTAVQTVIVRAFILRTVSYPDSKEYGPVSDDYQSNEEIAFWNAYQVVTTMVPFTLYMVGLLLMVITRGQTCQLVGTSSVDKKLFVPCFVNLVAFVLCQISITLLWGEGKWFTWMVTNSTLNSVIIILLSSHVRNEFSNFI